MATFVRPKVALHNVAYPPEKYTLQFFMISESGYGAIYKNFPDYKIFMTAQVYLLVSFYWTCLLGPNCDKHTRRLCTTEI